MLQTAFIALLWLGALVALIASFTLRDIEADGYQRAVPVRRNARLASAGITVLATFVTLFSTVVIVSAK